MAAKTQRIFELLQETQKSLSEPDNWTAFLRTAAWLYKYPFEDQALIYAQRPDATACASMDVWNNRMHRWINKGSKGIALLRETGNGYGLEYVFDVADTNDIYNREVRLWQYDERYDNAIKETLENIFGDIKESNSMYDVISRVVHNAVEDNKGDYLHELKFVKKDSLLNGLDSVNLDYRFRQTAEASIRYTVMCRMGINADDTVERDELEYIRDFNTPETIGILGNAVSSISEHALRNISETIRAEQRREKFDVRENRIYNRDSNNINQINTERTDNNGRDNIQDRGRLSDTGADGSAGEIQDRQIRDDAENISQRTPQEPVLGNADERNASEALGGNGQDSVRTGANDNIADGASGRRDGENESARPDEMDGTDEQFSPFSGGDSPNGRGVQLSLFDIALPSEEEQKKIIEQAEQARSAFSMPQQIIDEVLVSGSNERDSILDICVQYSKNKSQGNNIEFLKNHYKTGGKGFIFDGQKVAVWWNDDGIRIAYGDTAIGRGQLFSWEQADARIGELLNMGRYAPQETLDKLGEHERNTAARYFYEMYRDLNFDGYPDLRDGFDKDTWFKGSYPDTIARVSEMMTQPKMVKQFETLTENLANRYLEDTNIMRFRMYAPTKVLPVLRDLQLEHRHFTSHMEHNSPQRFITEDEIDKLFTRGSGTERGNIRIYLYFQEHTDMSERVNFLKKEYGTGGYGSGVFSEWHDAKGISFSRGDIFSPFAKVNISWTNAAKRIDKLIKSGQYITEKQINEDIPKYLSYQEQLRIRNEKIEFLNNTTQMTPQECRQTIPKKLRYYIDTIDLYDKQKFEDNGLSELTEASELEIADFIKNSEKRQRLMDCLNEIQNKTSDVHARGNAYNIRNDLAEMKIINLHKMGDFYEVFGDEAVQAAEVLDIALTRRHTDEGDIPMTGFPVFAAERYVNALEEKGYIVSFAEENVLNEIAAEENINDTDRSEEIEAEPETLPSLKVERDRDVYDIHSEIPMSERSDFKIENDTLGHGTMSEKYGANVEAIRTLKQINSEDRFATPEEQEILSRYVGWGGLADCFDERNSHYDELKSLLTEEEYAAARESSLTAFYTPPVVIRSMYKALENMGVKNANILEPSCGVGNFIGMKPDSMSNCKVYGVELDSISGQIAQQLYQTSSIQIKGYEDTQFPDSFFDVAIGNVPFGDFKVIDRRYNKNNFLIHDYFFAKTLDKVRPGGVIAFVTSSGTMDKKNSNVRKYIAQRADLVGAIRLSNDTFKANAGTEVTSDILFLQKRDRIVDIEPDWVHIGTDENGYIINQYFIDNPDMVLGEMKEISGPFGPQTACIAYEDADLSELLDGAIQNIHAQITEYEVDDLSNDEDLSIPADPNVKNFSYTVVDGDIYFRENSRMNKMDVSLTVANRIKGMIEIRDCVKELMEYQTEGYPDADIKAQQEKLNKLYDTYTAKYGLINSRGNNMAFSNDSSYFLLCSLEVLNDNGELERKADMFTKRTIGAKKEITHVDTASEALAVSLGEKARIDMEYMSQLTGKDEQKLFDELKGVIFLNPMHTNENDGKEKYLTADEYLSGNVREKLDWAKRSAELYPEDYTVNVEALTAVQPKDLTPAEITVRLGTTWIPPEYIKQFTFELLTPSYYAQSKIDVHYSNFTGNWNVSGKNSDRNNVKINNTYGTHRINALKIIEDTLNLRDVRIFDYVENEKGNKIAVLNHKETTIAQQKQEMIKAAFDSWIWKDPKRREHLTKLYNEKFNSVRTREYDGSHITFSGMNPEIQLRQHQKNAVARIMYGGNSLLGHVVGAGKTWTMAAAAMEMKRLGLCNKPMFVVPNHLTEQWASEFLQLYPAANIIVTTKKDFETKNRKKFCGRIATGDYDAIIIGHSQFEKIPMSKERQEAVLRNQMEDILSGISEAKANNAERFTVKQMERTKKNLKSKIDKLNDTRRKDDVVTFEELGVDRLFVDEAHSYKNLFLVTKMRNVGGIAQTDAQKSSDMFMKCRYLDELTGGKGNIFATGTPISNSMVELYTMQRYLQYDMLEKSDLQHFDAWASTFGETVTAIELAPEGTGYRSKTRFAKFYNIPELMTMFREVADIQTADMLNLPVPKAEYHNIAVEPTEIQREMVAELGERAEQVRAGIVDPTSDNMLKITNDGRKLALDQRLMNDMLADEEGTKVDTCANNVFEIWEKTSEFKGTQLVFCDSSTPTGKKSGRQRQLAAFDEVKSGEPKKDGNFNVYDDIRSKLISKGVPESDIAFIHDADNDVKKKELFAKVRRGDVRILLGSTQKMGAGPTYKRGFMPVMT